MGGVALDAMLAPGYPLLSVISALKNRDIQYFM